MKNLSRLILVSAVLGSTSSQASTIGAAVGGGLWGENTDGGIGSNYAYVSGNETTDGSLPAVFQYHYRAEASFNIGALTPVLRAEAFADDLTSLSDPYINGEAYALQTYRNSSGTTQTYTLNLNLDGDVLDAPGSSYIDAEVGVFIGSDIFASYTSCSPGTAQYLAGFNSWACGAQVAAGFTPYIEISGGLQSISDTVSFDIAAGDSFTLYAELLALTFGGYADAFSTLDMTFDDTTNLIALGDMSPVPVPAAGWLFGSGLIALVGLSRRKTRV
jgi:hypothetical protein